MSDRQTKGGNVPNVSHKLCQNYVWEAAYTAWKLTVGSSLMHTLSPSVLWAQGDHVFFKSLCEIH